MSTAPVRQTRQRAAIKAIFATTDEFRTAQQVHSALLEAGDKVGLATVYRTLQSMAELDELDAVRSPEGEMTYRACSKGHHHHLICRSCGKAVEISASHVEEWAQRVALEYGFRDAGHDLEVFGLCSDC